MDSFARAFDKPYLSVEETCEDGIKSSGEEVTFQANFSLISSVPGIAEPHGVNDCNPFPLLLNDLSVSRTKSICSEVL